jgi:hypothetical protein
MVGALAAKVDPLLGLRHEWGHRGARARQAVRSAIARVDWVRFCPNRASADGAYHASVDSGWEGQQRAKRRRWGARIHRSRHASTLYRGKPLETSNPLAVWRKRSTRELGSDLVSHARIIPRAYCGSRRKQPVARDRTPRGGLDRGGKGVLRCCFSSSLSVLFSISRREGRGSGQARFLSPAALRSTSLIRAVHPGPEALKCSTTSGSSRNVSCVLTGFDFCGPR